MATKVITGVNTRWFYANVWEPKAMEGGKPKFSVSLIIPKAIAYPVPFIPNPNNNQIRFTYYF